MADVATFDVAVELPHELVRSRRAARTPQEAPVVQRRQVQSSVSRWSSRREARRWPLTWTSATYGQARRLRELLDLSLGGAQTLTWTPTEGGSPISVSIVPWSFSHVQETASRWRVSLLLEERI